MASQFANRIRGALDRLDNRLSRLGRLGSSAAVTAMAVVAALPLHFLVRKLEGLPMHGSALLNLGAEVALVAGPIIFYSRAVIGELKRSRARLREMSRQLEFTAEEAKAASRAKSAFLANMSHELRTPLNAIMGFSEVMKDQHLGPVHNTRYLGYAADIHASGRHLLGIINDILDLSKIEAGKMTLDQAREFSLRAALEASLGLVSPLGEKFGVTLHSDLPDAGVRMVGMERMVCQIMINLVGNAIKFTPAGGMVHVSGALDNDGGYRLLVRDSGVGMTANEMRHALTPFGQVENRMTARHTGTGLGLPLAKAMTELHSGTLDMISAPGEGTTITITFPAVRMCPARSQAA